MVKRWKAGEFKDGMKLKGLAVRSYEISSCVSVETRADSLDSNCKSIIIKIKMA